MARDTLRAPCCLLAICALLSLAACDAPLPPREDVPKLAVDTGWPTIPAGAKFGEVSAVDVDAEGNVWVLHRAGRKWEEPFPTEPIPEPTVFKFSPEGKLLAQWGAGLFGIETVVQGTEILSTGNKWTPLEIDEGCGGIRSLMALIMIASVWAYLAPIALWKKALLCLAAFPLAIFGNMLRLTSIFVIAEYGDAEFARNTWHDWSGLLLFYPISLMLLLGVHSVLEGGWPWKRQKKIAVRTIVRKQVEVN